MLLGIAPWADQRGSALKAPGMPSYGRQLNDNEVAAVLTYIRSRWGGIADPIASEQVSKVWLDTGLRSD
jgi:mono/diheme cytochrome c family protein